MTIRDLLVVFLRNVGSRNPILRRFSSYKGMFRVLSIKHRIITNMDQATFVEVMPEESASQLS